MVLDVSRMGIIFSIHFLRMFITAEHCSLDGGRQTCSVTQLCSVDKGRLTCSVAEHCSENRGLRRGAGAGIHHSSGTGSGPDTEPKSGRVWVGNAWVGCSTLVNTC